MKISGHHILITGGTGGIGYALAKRFKKAGSEVIVCGRRQEQLDIISKEGFHTIQCDVGIDSERVKLVNTVLSKYPKINILINNAGIQRRPPPLWEPQNFDEYKYEMAVNIEAPVHLSMLFLPHLLKQNSPAIMNVSSGLSFVPIAFMPTYCLTKAALHSFTLSLRAQTKKKGVHVVEIVPPAVNTDLGGKGLHNEGVPLDEFADHAMKEIEKGSIEFGYGFSEKGRLASRTELDKFYAHLNASYL